ncbi:MAG: PsiF family protein [Roseiarcus sp.]|jgi:invasion protein IalB
MKITTLAAAAAMTALLMGGAAFAQTYAPAPAEPAPAAAPAAPAAAPAPAVHSAKSVECSKEADAKGLHGEPRRKFRAECKKGK